MKEGTEAGLWWLPNASDHRVPGEVTFDPDGIQLRVDLQLEPFDPTVVTQGNANHTIPIVHGSVRGGGDITLLDVSGHRLIGPAGPDEQEFSVGAIVEGLLLSTDSFDAAVFMFDVLTPWVNPPGIADNGAILVLPGLRPIDSASVGHDSVELLVGSLGKAGSDAVHLERATALRVELAVGASVADIITNYVRPIQDLLTLVLGRAVRLTTLMCRPTGGAQFGDVRLPILQAAPAGPVTTSTLMHYSSPTLLMFNELVAAVPFSSLVPAWFALRSKRSSVLNLLLSSHYMPVMYNELRFTTTYQCAEAYGRALYGGAELSKPAHHQRRKDIQNVLAHARIPVRRSRQQRSRNRDVGRAVARRSLARQPYRTLDAEVLAFAKRRTDINEKTLRSVVSELLNDSGAFGAAVLGANPEFDGLLSGDRGGLSHGSKSSGVTAEERQWNTEALQWLLRARLLRELGVPEPTLDTKASRQLFQRAIKSIREAAAP